MKINSVNHAYVWNKSQLTDDQEDFSQIAMKTAIAQYRISTGKQEREWDSFGNQDVYCKDYCKNNNLKLVKIFQEVTTWKKSDEETFQESIQYGKENKIDYFIIFDIDRFTRDWYWTYEKVKERIEKNWMKLRDAKNIIQPSNVVFKNDLVDLSKYDWNIETPSEYAEAIMATNAKIEWKKILQRTILREVELEQMGYQVRQANYWFMNKKIAIQHWKAVIQVPLLPESECMLEMYEYRIAWILNDSRIVEELTLKWYRKRSGKEFTEQAVQRMIQNPIYAWIKKTKWTGNKPIRTPYKGLVDIETWNKANRGKVEIIEINDTEIKMEYNDWKQKQINEPIIKKKKNYNPEYPFSKVLMCAHCDGNLTASTSRSKTGAKHHYYHCTWKKWRKHSTYGLRRNEVHRVILEIIQAIKVEKNTLIIYEDISKEIFEEQSKEFQDNITTYKKQIQELSHKEKEIIENIDKIINFPTILESKNKELENIKKLKEKLDNQTRKKSPNNTNLKKFIHYSKKVITHLDKLALQSENPALINLVFDIVFNGKIEYEKLKKHTQQINEFSSIQSQQKNLQKGEILTNPLWGARWGSNPRPPESQPGILTNWTTGTIYAVFHKARGLY